MTMMTSEECNKRHWAFGIKLVLACAGSVAAIMLSLGLMIWDTQAATAEKLEQRIRQTEQFRASTEVQLNRIADDIKEIKEAVRRPVTVKP